LLLYLFSELTAQVLVIGVAADKDMTVDFGDRSVR
jgi:hypothetical protein